MKFKHIALINNRSKKKKTTIFTVESSQLQLDNAYNVHFRFQWKSKMTQLGSYYDW